MKRILLLSQLFLALLVSTQAFALNETKAIHAGFLQQIYILNTLWNQNATGGVRGLTPTSVVVAFNNGGSKPCYTTTLAFNQATTILVGTGEACVAEVLTVSITPVAGPAGMVYATPTPVTLNGSYYSTEITLTDNADPIFDTTNGAVHAQGSVQAAMVCS